MITLLMVWAVIAGSVIAFIAAGIVADAIHRASCDQVEPINAGMKKLRQTIDRDRYPLSPRLKPFKSALAKLDPASMPKPAVERKPLPEAPARSRGGRRTRR